MDVDIKTLPEMRIAGLRHVGSYATVSEAFARLGGIAGKAGLFHDSKAAMIAVYHDDPQTTPESELRSDAGIVISEKASIPPELSELRIPAGRYACAIHAGPYDSLPNAWKELTSLLLPAKGLRPAPTASYELYLNNPMTVAADKLLTEIRIPIQL